MDDELKQLEAELKRLQPMPPSPVLVARVERELTKPAAEVRRPRATVVRWLWAALPAAAAIALVFVQFSREREKPQPRGGIVLAPQGSSPSAPAGSGEVAATPAGLKPVSAENVLVSATDEGVITLADGTPARRERLQYVDTITWKNPSTNASLTWRVPREEVRVVPVSFQ